MGQLPRTGKRWPNFFEAWPDIFRCLSIRPSTAEYKAITNLWALLQALFCTYQGPNPLNSATVARDFPVALYCWYNIMVATEPEA